MFHCFREHDCPYREERHKCEWVYLRPFVDWYNSQHSTTYIFNGCPDLEERKEPAPDVRIICDGLPNILLERKSLVWPDDYFARHRAEHEFSQHIIEELRSEEWDAAYVVEVDFSLRRVQNQNIWRNQASDIAANIRNHYPELQYRNPIIFNKPCQWILRLGDPNGLDPGAPSPGIGVIIIDSDDSYENPDRFIEMKEEAMRRVRCEALTAFDASQRKFCASPRGCICILVIELSGQLGDVLNEDEIAAIIHEVERPDVIDEVYLAIPEYVTNDQYVPTYLPIFGHGK